MVALVAVRQLSHLWWHQLLSPRPHPPRPPRVGEGDRRPPTQEAARECAVAVTVAACHPADATPGTCPQPATTARRRRITPAAMAEPRCRTLPRLITRSTGTTGGVGPTPRQAGGRIPSLCQRQPGLAAEDAQGHRLAGTRGQCRHLCQDLRVRLELLPQPFRLVCCQEPGGGQGGSGATERDRAGQGGRAGMQAGGGVQTGRQAGRQTGRQVRKQYHLRERRAGADSAHAWQSGAAGERTSGGACLRQQSSSLACAGAASAPRVG